MLTAAAALVCVCAAAWCSPAAAAAGGRPDSGNFLDDKQWLTTISQYDKEVGQWNKFRDVSSARRACQPAAAPGPLPLVPFVEGIPWGAGTGVQPQLPPFSSNFNSYFNCLRRLGEEVGGPAGQFPVRCRRGAARTARRAPGRAGRPARTFGPQRAGPWEPLPACGSPGGGGWGAAFVLPPPVSRPAAGSDAVGAPGPAGVGGRPAAAPPVPPGQSPLPPASPGTLQRRRAGPPRLAVPCQKCRQGGRGRRGSARGRGLPCQGRGASARRVRGVRSAVLGAREQQPQPDPNLISYETCRCKVALSSAGFACAPRSGCVCCQVE